MSRVICGLKWARGPVPRPENLPKGRPRGAKAEGLRYERLVCSRLEQGKPGLWWEFEDQNGHGFCQTDLVLFGPTQVLVVEVKLSATDAAWKQLGKLYLPVLGMALGKNCYGLQMAKNLWGKQTGVKVCKTLGEALPALKAGENRVLVHWAGLGPLF